MKAASWALARNVAFHDRNLYLMIKSFLSHQLYELHENLEFFRQTNIPVQQQLRMPGDDQHFCDLCNQEVHSRVMK